MLMFHADIAFALELIALAFGLFLLIWIRMHLEQTCKVCGFLAYFIVVLAILALLCTSYYTVKYWVGGYFNSPNPLMMQRGKMQPMMRGCMMNNSKMPMMKNCMSQKKMMSGKKMGAMPATMKKQMMKGKKMQAPNQIMPVGNSGHAAHH